MAKQYKVGFKTINAKLMVTKKHLNKIKKKVTKKDQKAIAAQIQAIDLILTACKTTKMSVTYTGNDD
ncbi:MAG TPA: hypothetical protein VK728_16270 [Candidatus Sulfotelmatobacter sp.]|nr:hypothetical protein [Candidatus Sulfotelmatobacter sp.]